MLVNHPGRNQGKEWRDKSKWQSIRIRIHHTRINVVYIRVKQGFKLSSVNSGTPPMYHLHVNIALNDVYQGSVKIKYKCCGSKVLETKLQRVFIPKQTK